MSILWWPYNAKFVSCLHAFSFPFFKDGFEQGHAEFKRNCSVNVIHRDVCCKQQNNMQAIIMQAAQRSVCQGSNILVGWSAHTLWTWTRDCESVPGRTLSIFILHSWQFSLQTALPDISIGFDRQFHRQPWIMIDCKAASPFTSQAREDKWIAWPRWTEHLRNLEDLLAKSVHKEWIHARSGTHCWLVELAFLLARGYRISTQKAVKATVRMVRFQQTGRPTAKCRDNCQLFAPRLSTHCIKYVI